MEREELNLSRARFIYLHRGGRCYGKYKDRNDLIEREIGKESNIIKEEEIDGEKGTIQEGKKVKVITFLKDGKEKKISYFIGDDGYLYKINKGGIFKKVGAIVGVSQLLLRGRTKPSVYIDIDSNKFEHITDENLPVFDDIWGDISGVLGLKEKNEVVYQKVLNGENIEVEEELTPEYAFLLDDKNEIPPGELEKALSIMMHPENRHITIGTPNIFITEPVGKEGIVSSKWIRTMKMARDIHNKSEAFSLREIHGRASPFFGKGIVRFRDYNRKLIEGELLNPAHAASHDWQESVYTYAEALYGPKRLKVIWKKIDENEEIWRVVRGKEVMEYRVRREGDDVILEKKRGEEFNYERRFSDLGRNDSDYIAKYVSNFLNGSVNVGERDSLSYITNLERDVRWLRGDIEMIKTMQGYKKQLFPAARFHLGQLRRRLFGDPAFLTWIGLTSLPWFIPFIGGIINPVLAVSVFGITMAGIIGIDKIIAPIKFRIGEIRRIREEGEKISKRTISGIILNQIYRGTVETVLITLVCLMNLIIRPIAIFGKGGVFWVERKGKPFTWKTSSQGAVREVKGIPLKEHFTAFKQPFTAGLITLASLVALCSLNIVPVSIFGLFGVGVYLSSLILGPLASWYTARPAAKSKVKGAICGKN